MAQTGLKGPPTSNPPLAAAPVQTILRMGAQQRIRPSICATRTEPFSAFGRIPALGLNSTRAGIGNLRYSCVVPAIARTKNNRRRIDTKLEYITQTANLKPTTSFSKRVLTVGPRSDLCARRAHTYLVSLNVTKAGRTGRQTTRATIEVARFGNFCF